MRNYVKPTIGDVELRPEEGLACWHSEGSGCSCGSYTGGSFGGFIGGNFQSFDWNAVLEKIRELFRRWRG